MTRRSRLEYSSTARLEYGIFNLPNQAAPSNIFVTRTYMDAAVHSQKLQIQLSHTNRITEAACEVLPSTNTI